MPIFKTTFTQSKTKWYPRQIARHAGYTCYKITPDKNMDLIGYIYVNNATLVGSGGTKQTLTDASSTISITP